MHRRLMPFRRPSLLSLRQLSRIVSSEEKEPTVVIEGTPAGCLTPDEILTADLDQDKLSESAKLHLQQCESCSSQVYVSE